MRANHRMQRLFVADPLAAGGSVSPSPAQSHYLGNVLRLAEGAELLVFNGRDGEWRARVAQLSRRGIRIEAVEQTRSQPSPSELHFCFAPLKQGRLDYLVQKAVEMGAGVIEPVSTQHTQTPLPKRERMEANAVEAAEQCGVLSVPVIRDGSKLDRLIEGWDPARRLIFCDEGADGDNPLPVLRAIAETRLALLVGPEGGFSAAERLMLRALPFVSAIPLGPRILRADTAAVAALALVQATVGDWR